MEVIIRVRPLTDADSQLPIALRHERNHKSVLVDGEKKGVPAAVFPCDWVADGSTTQVRPVNPIRCVFVDLIRLAIVRRLVVVVCMGRMV